MSVRAGLQDARAKHEEALTGDRCQSPDKSGAVDTIALADDVI